MPTSVILDPLAQEALKGLKRRLKAEEGHDASERRIVGALVYGATPTQAAGMLIAFTRAVEARAASGQPPGSGDPPIGVEPPANRRGAQDRAP
jgi:hypothetical protein